MLVNPWAGKTNLNKSTDEEKNGGRGEENGEEEVDNSHDPHFEPIIPLPDAIEVSTGEENETICKWFFFKNHFINDFLYNIVIMF